MQAFIPVRMPNCTNKEQNRLLQVSSTLRNEHLNHKKIIKIKIKKRNYKSKDLQNDLELLPAQGIIYAKLNCSSG